VRFIEATALFLVVFLPSGRLGSQVRRVGHRGKSASKAQKIDIRKLNSRATRYIVMLKRVIFRCTMCDGRGKRLIQTFGFRGRSFWKKCSYCEGTGIYIKEKNLRKVYEEFMSPEWWARSDPESRIAQFMAYLSRDRSKSLKMIRSMRLDFRMTKVIGGRLGFTFVKKGKRRESLAWVKRGGKWYIWSKYDGCIRNLFQDREITNYSNISEREIKSILEKVRFAFPLTLVDLCKGRLRLDFYVESMGDLKLFGGRGKALDRPVVDLVRILFGLEKGYTSVEINFLTRYKDIYGNLSVKRCLHLSIRADVFNLLKLENLEPGEVIENHFDVSWCSYKGETAFQPPRDPVKRGEKGTLERELERKKTLGDRPLRSTIRIR